MADFVGPRTEAVFSHMHKLLFLEGTHGNFLARCLSVASGVTKDFDFYKDSLGAHNPNFTNIVEHYHCFDVTDIFCYINFELDDLYVLAWHVYLANYEFDLDLLRTNSFEKWTQHLQGKKWHTAYEGAIQTLDLVADSGVPGLREMYKKYHTGFYLIEKHKDILNKHNIRNLFQFKWFYEKDTFITQCKLLLEDLGYTYRFDIGHKWEDFMQNKKNILKSKELVHYAFLCYTNSIPLNISNLCVYEQAYLDSLIEQHLGYEIELWQEYPTNTRDIKPIKAWEGERYAL